ncbi:MAG: efflux RND transporter periplasmic adaptor subunit [Candidatus Eisenbacteria bacterium]
MRRVIRFAALLAFVVPVLAGCGAAPKPRTPRVPVAVTMVRSTTVPLELDATGTVEPLESATVHGRVSGIVEAVAFRPGQDVRAGDVLFRIDPRPYQAALDQARGTLARDRAQLAAAAQDAQRAVTLRDQQLIAPADYDQKIATADGLRAAVAADSAAVEAAAINVAFATVRAPISGRTGDRLVRPGDLVKADATDQPLVVINQVHPILVRFTVPESDLPALRAHTGRDLRVFATVGVDSTAVEGHLVFVDNAVDPTTGTVLLKGEFPNRDGRLWPGQSATVTLRLYDQPGAIVIPATAITQSQNGTFVFVVLPDTTVRMQRVTVARTARDVSVIADGVRAGETVVVDGQFRLTPGARVMIKSPAPTPPAAAARGKRS